MLEQMDINKHNFSKIGKYISNKLHHIHQRSNKKHHSGSICLDASPRSAHQSQPLKEKKNKIVDRKKQQWYEPCVGTYSVNYAVVDKNLHLSNFSRTTPHFHNQKYNIHQSTPLLKEYPDGPSPKNKGFTELKRMPGREDIKGSIRKNLENPHEARFETYKFPTLAFDSKGVSFSKMTQRKGMQDSQRANGAEYDCAFELKLKRLDSHIIPFQKQTSRPQCLFEEKNVPDSCRYEQNEVKQSVNRSVEWSRQLSRQVEGLLPGYMQKTVTSRMAISHINLKTLEMNCTDLKERRKLPRRRYGSKQKTTLYTQINRLQGGH